MQTFPNFRNLSTSRREIGRRPITYKVFGTPGKYANDRFMVDSNRNSLVDTPTPAQKEVVFSSSSEYNTGGDMEVFPLQCPYCLSWKPLAFFILLL